MQTDLRQFWQRLQSGVEVAVAGTQPDRLFGVRDGFRRYLLEGPARSVPVAVVPQPEDDEGRSGLELSDADIVAIARRKAQRMQERLGDAYHFYVGTEGGLHGVEVEDSVHYFVRCWAVILGRPGESWGASGSIEIPARLLSGLDDHEIAHSVPGTRRSGGMISSLSGGLETRRTAIAEATFHALASLFYGLLESRPLRGRQTA